MKTPPDGVHPRQAPRSAQRPRSGLGERIVAAGVEDRDHPSGALGPEPLDDVGGVERLILDESGLALAGGGDIDRQQPVLAVDLETMPGKVKHHGVAGLDPALDIGKRPAHLALGAVLHQFDLETRPIAARS